MTPTTQSTIPIQPRMYPAWATPPLVARARAASLLALRPRMIATMLEQTAAEQPDDPEDERRRPRAVLRCRAAGVGSYCGAAPGVRRRRAVRRAGRWWGGGGTAPGGGGVTGSASGPWIPLGHVQDRSEIGCGTRSPRRRGGRRVRPHRAVTSRPAPRRPWTQTNRGGVAPPRRTVTTDVAVPSPAPDPGHPDLRSPAGSWSGSPGGSGAPCAGHLLGDRCGWSRRPRSPRRSVWRSGRPPTAMPGHDRRCARRAGPRRVRQAAAGVLRHRMAVTNWITAASRTQQLVVRRSTHLGSALSREVATGEVVAVTSSDVEKIGSAFDVFARFVGAIVAFFAVATLLLDRAAARFARPRLRAVPAAASARCSARSSAASRPSAIWSVGPRSSHPTRSPACACCAASAARTCSWSGSGRRPSRSAPPRSTSPGSGRCSSPCRSPSPACSSWRSPASVRARSSPDP